DRLAVRLKQQTVLHADETPVQQLDPGAGKTKRAYLWAYRSNDRIRPIAPRCVRSVNQLAVVEFRGSSSSMRPLGQVGRRSRVAV
ncbi:IS66 family transposase, partial [Parachitinimonas caeni]